MLAHTFHLEFVASLDHLGPSLFCKYARQIARDWNVKASGAGFVTKFAVSGDYLKGFDVHVVGGFQLAEHWIPAEQLDEFNQNILGIMDVVAEFRPERSSKE
jgi:hypothetical protein